MRAAGYRRARVAARGSGLGGKPADLARIHPPRSALVPGQHAVLAFPRRFPASKPVSRYQLALAILMFIGSPAWIGLLVLGTLALCIRRSTRRDSSAPMPASRLFVCVLVMWFSPKIASAIDVLLRPELRRAFGGAGLFLVNYAIETVYSILLCPIFWFGHTIFLAGLAVRPRNRMDRTDPRRSRGAIHAGAAQSVAAHAARMRRARRCWR